MLIFLTINSPLNLAYLFFLANVIDLRKTKKSLVDICMDETGGLGVDCVIDNGGNYYFSIYLRLHTRKKCCEKMLIFFLTVVRQDDEVKEQGDMSSLSSKNPLPSKHDVICCLAVAGRWITSLQDLQVGLIVSAHLVVQVMYRYDARFHKWTFRAYTKG